jgi:thiamine-phosphate pyrophosphorylase
LSAGVEIFSNPGLYPILDYDYCLIQKIDLFRLPEVWEKYPSQVKFFQFRGKTLSDEDYEKIYLELNKKFYNLPIIINDKWEIALKNKAFGIHLGKEDWENLNITNKLKIQSSNLLKGTSSHSISDILNLHKDVWDYTGLGPVYSSTTKITERKSLGLEVVLKARLIINLPIVLIGGINEKNWNEIKQAGEFWLASISAFSDENIFKKLVETV